MSGAAGAGGLRPTSAELRAVAGSWLTARALVAVALLAAWAAATELAPGTDPLHLEQGLVTWDGDWFRFIAERGYGPNPGSDPPLEAVRFFPLYPLLARALAWLPGVSVEVALVVLANAAAVVAAVLLHRLVARDLGAGRAEASEGAEALAERSTWLLALFPTASVLVYAYGEGLFLALSIGAYAQARRRRWWWAALWGVLAGLTRPTGVLLAVPLAWEAARGLRSAPAGERAARVGAVAAPLVGVGAFLVWAGVRFDDWALPLDIQRQLRAGFQDPVTRLVEAVVELGEASAPDVANLVLTLVLVGLVVVCGRRLPGSATAYAAVSVAVALAAENIDSVGRYGLVAFPLLVALATVARPGWPERVVLATSAGGLVALTVMAAVGGYTP